MIDRTFFARRSGRRSHADRGLVAAFCLGALGCASAAPLSPDPSVAKETRPAATAPPAPSYAGLDASLWIQGAEEARLIREATYAAAARSLVEALADPRRSAFDGEAGDGAPPAAVLDLDETVLDNSPYNAWLTARGERFGPANWSLWVDAAEAKAIPGALEFARAARELGVTLYYVSNRDAPMEGATRANLEALGFPLDAQSDCVLLRGERPEWSSDKSSRYAEAARRHRVVVLIGDDLNDFLPIPAGATPSTRRELVEPVRTRFGRDWFLLPNPVHGSWMRAAVAGQLEGDPEATETARKLEALELFHPPVSPP